MILEADIIILDIPWVGPSSNKIYSGMHWAERKRIADEGHLLAKSAGMRFKRLYGARKGPVEITITAHHPGRYDVDNYGFTGKIIIDGLVRSGLLPDDTDKTVVGVMYRPRVKDKNPHTIVEIRSVEDVRGEI